MKTINLVNPEKSEIKYKISKFPDGQQNITIDPEWDYTNRGGDNNPRYGYRRPTSYDQPIKIISRLNNFLQLEIIIATVASLKEFGCTEIHLYIPYFMGARSDRKFEEGGNWYLKDVICPIINSLNFKSVSVLDAHSWVLGNLLKNYNGFSNHGFVAKFAIPEIIKTMELPAVQTDVYHTTSELELYYDKRGFDNILFVSPDAGASHKIEKLASILNYNGSILTCTKERDENGKLSKINVPLMGRHYGKEFVIIDDICDGGRTFINIAKEIRAIARDAGITPKIHLVVTHGIFSAGFNELFDNIDYIYCTNSYSDVNPDQVRVQSKQSSSDFVKQLNIF